MKKIISIALAAIMVLALVPVGLFAFAAEPKTGTTDWSAVDAASATGDLFINSAEDWSAFLGKTGTYENATIYLTKDLDVSAVTGVGPIADFKGTLDGQGFKLTKVSTLLFTTLTGALKNVELNMNYYFKVGEVGTHVTGSAIGTVNGTVADVVVSGFLFVGGKSTAAQNENAFIGTVNGAVKNLTFSDLQAACADGGAYINTIAAGSNVDGVTVAGNTAEGHNTYTHSAIRNINAGAVVKNVTLKDTGRMGIYQLEGTIDGMVIDNCGDIAIRNPKATGLVKNLVIKNVTNAAKPFNLIYAPVCDAGFTIDGLTIDSTTTVPLFNANYGAYVNENMTIKNAVINNGSAAYFGEVKGVIDGLTINGSTVSPITSVTGTLKNVAFSGAANAPAIKDKVKTIATADEWKAFLEDTTNTYEGITVQLTTLLDVSGVTGVGPIVDFKGYFDGQGNALADVTTTLFTTLSGSLSNVILDMNYETVTGKAIDTVNGCVSNVTVKGYLYVGGKSTTAQNENAFIGTVNGAVKNVTFSDLQAACADGGSYINTIAAGSNVDGVTVAGNTAEGHNTYTHSAIRYINAGAVVKNVTLKDTGRMGIYELAGTIDGMVIDNCGDIAIRNPKATGLVKNLVIKNVTNAAKPFNLIYAPVCDAGFTIDGLTIDSTTTVPLFNANYGAFVNENLTIKNVVTNNGSANYFGEVKGTIDGLRVDANTASIIGSVASTGSVTNVVQTNSTVPVITGGTVDSLITITNADEWKAFLDDEDNTYEGKIVKLNGLIDVKDVTGVGPIKNFKGTFDGQDGALLGVKTGIFETLTGSFSNVTVQLAYFDMDTTTGLDADMIVTMNGTMENVTVSGYLHNGTSGDPAISQMNLVINDVNGKIKNLSLKGLEGFTGQDGKLIANINDGAEVDGLTLTGEDSSVWRAIGLVAENATVKNVSVKDFNRTVFGLIYGTIENVTIENASDIAFREPKPGSVVKNLVIKNLAAKAGFNNFTLIYPSICEGLTIDGMTVDETVVVPLIQWANANRYMHENMTIKNLVVNNGAATLFDEVQGTIDGMTVTGNTVAVLGKVADSGSVDTSKIAVNNNLAPVIAEPAWPAPAASSSSSAASSSSSAASSSSSVASSSSSAASSSSVAASGSSVVASSSSAAASSSSAAASSSSAAASSSSVAASGSSVVASSSSAAATSSSVETGDATFTLFVIAAIILSAAAFAVVSKARS